MRLKSAALSLLLWLMPGVGFANVLTEPIPGLIAPPTAPSVTTVDGVKVTMVTAVSKESPEMLRSHYTVYLLGQKLFMAEDVRDIRLPNAVQVTAIDTENMISYTVILQPGAKKTTTIILSAAELARGPKPVALSFAPVIPGAQGVTSAQLEFMQTISYQTYSTPAEAKAFYRAELGKLGYKEVEELIWAKDGERMSVVVAPGVATRSVMIVRELAGEEKNESSAPPPPPLVGRPDAKADGGTKLSRP